MEQFDVIIIGAGAAGLAAAKALRDFGVINTCILEAQDDIGGRIKTSFDWGQPIELGAEFIHGDQTITATLARDLDLKTVSAHEDFALIDEDGTPLDQGARNTFRSLIDYVSDHGKPGISVAKCIDNNPITTDDKLKNFAKNSIADSEGAEAVDLDSAAYSSNEAVWGYHGENIILADGYQPVLFNLAEGANIKMDSAVAAVDQTDEHGILISLQNGTDLWARRVIITCPLGVLKQQSISFVPALPAEKTMAIDTLGMANTIKYFIRFRSPIAGSIFQFSDGGNSSLQTITNWWASAANPHVLVGYCGGNRAQRLVHLSPERLQEKVTADLSKIYGDNLRDEIIDCRLSRWDNNPFTGGSYSYNPVGVTAATRKALAAPNGNLFWAGEATATDGGSYGTVHGAIMSGYRAAEEVLNSLRNN